MPAASYRRVAPVAFALSTLSWILVAPRAASDANPCSSSARPTPRPRPASITPRSPIQPTGAKQIAGHDPDGRAVQLGDRGERRVPGVGLDHVVQVVLEAHGIHPEMPRERPDRSAASRAGRRRPPRMGGSSRSAAARSVGTTHRSAAACARTRARTRSPPPPPRGRRPPRRRTMPTGSACRPRSSGPLARSARAAPAGPRRDAAGSTGRNESIVEEGSVDPRPAKPQGLPSASSTIHAPRCPELVQSSLIQTSDTSSNPTSCRSHARRIATAASRSWSTVAGRSR